MIPTEHHYNPFEQTAGYLRDALKIVDELDPPEALRPAAFVKAVDLLSQKHVTLEQPAAIPPGILRGH